MFETFEIFEKFSLNKQNMWKNTINFWFLGTARNFWFLGPASSFLKYEKNFI